MRRASTADRTSGVADKPVTEGELDRKLDIRVVLYQWRRYFIVGLNLARTLLAERELRYILRPVAAERETLKIR